MFAAVEFLQGIDQSNHAGMDHIFEQHMTGQPFVNAAGDVTHLRQLLYQQPLAFTVILATGNGSLALFGHGSPSRNRARGCASRAGGSRNSDICRLNAGELRRRLVGD